MDNKAVAVIVALILLILAYFTYGYFFKDIGNPVSKLSGEQCTLAGGEIVNTLGTTAIGDKCPIGKRSIGDVEGMRCPCICCVSD